MAHCLHGGEAQSPEARMRLPHHLKAQGPTGWMGVGGPSESGGGTVPPAEQ